MKLDKKYQSYLLIVLIGVFFYWGLNNISIFIQILLRGLRIILPFIVGGCIAFLLNIPMKHMERALHKQTIVPKGWYRPLAFMLTLLIISLFVVVVFVVVIPELVNSIEMAINYIPDAITSLQMHINNLLSSYPDVLDISNLSSSAVAFLQSFASNLFNSSLSIAGSVISTITTLFVGFTFAVYVLFQKESLSIQVRKICYGILNEKVADYGVYLAKMATKTFENFLAGQGIESLILGTIFYIALTIFRMPYALLISVIIMVFSIIPIFGAIFGSIIGVLLILLVNPVQALWFFILFQVIQQIEGNFIYPHVVGKSVGLPSLWVLFSITVGGSLFGIIGMLIAIPLFSIFYVLLRDFVHHQLKKRNIDKEKIA